MSKTDNFAEINIDNLMAMKGELPFGVYVRLNNNKYTLIFKKGDKVDKDRFQQYSQKGIKELFIQKTDRGDYIQATEVLLNKLSDIRATEPVDKMKVLEELTEQTMFEIFEDKIFDEDSLRRSQTIIQSYVEILKNDPKSLATFISMSHNETYPCRHGIATAVFSVLLAKAHQNDNEKTLMLIGLGGLLHDIGMSKLPEDFDDVNRKLTPQEWGLVKKHPQYGMDMINDIKSFPDEVKLVIEQHHEHWDGSGYPRGLKQTEIFYPARVVAIADAFSALTTKRGGRSLYKPEDALALLLTEQGKYDPQLIKAFRSLFNIAPIKKAA